MNLMAFTHDIPLLVKKIVTVVASLKPERIYSISRFSSKGKFNCHCSIFLKSNVF